MRYVTAAILYASDDIRFQPRDPEDGGGETERIDCKAREEFYAELAATGPHEPTVLVIHDAGEEP